MYRKCLKVIICSLCLISLLIFAFNYRSLFRVFKKEYGFSYHNVDCISVKYTDTNLIKISDDNDIKSILDYLNSMEMIKEKIPNKEKALYHENWEEYENKLSEIGYFSILISDNTMVFTTEYVTVTTDGCDDEQHRTSYYIKNSGYDTENKTSNLYDFLKEITNKYT